jgi:predicted PurR-regulated permease PerM
VSVMTGYNLHPSDEYGATASAQGAMRATNRVTFIFLAVLTAVALYFCYLLVAPFQKPIAFSIILAIAFYPVQAWNCGWIRNRTVAALISTIFVILVITLGTVFLGGAIVSGLSDIYQAFSNPSNGKEKLGPYIVHVLERVAGWINFHLPGSIPGVQDAISSQAEKIVSALLAMSAGVLGGFTNLIVDALISFFILFFLFRDGVSMLSRVADVFPLSPEQVTRLIECVKDTVNAILYGTLAIAILQGTLTAIAFLFLGIASPVLWGVVTSLCALLPVIGTAFVFLPALGMLLINGHWIKALILLVWAIAVVHPVDNVLRPYLIGGKTNLSTLYVFIALLGGVKTFGALGIFIGPLILAVTVALFRFQKEEKEDGSWNLIAT